MPTDRLIRLSDAVLSSNFATLASAQSISAVAQPAANSVAIDSAVASSPVAGIAAMRVERAALMQPIHSAVLADVHLARIRPRLDRIRPELFQPEAEAAPGYTRSEATHPISPVAQPSDAVLFEDGKDPAKTYWLPRYRLRRDQGRYEIAQAEEADGLFTMRFGLEPFPAPELAAATAQPLPHRLGVTLKYRAANSDIEKQLPAAELAPDPRGHVLTLKLTLEERDSLLRAFRSDFAGAQLVLTRAIDVAVPLPPATTSEQPKGAFRFERGALHAVRRVDPEMMRAAVLREPSRAVEAAAFARVSGRTLGRRRRAPFIGDGEVVDSPAPPPPPAEPRFADFSGILECAVSLRFDQADHPYLFPAGASTSATPEFERILLRYPPDDPAGRVHAYFRAVSRPDRFYFLPDAFKLARTGEAPFTPALVFRVDEDETTGASHVELTCDIRPETDGKRLLAAKAGLRAHVRVQGGSGPGDLVLEPLTARARLRLGLPRGGAVQMVDTAAEVDLANGFLLSERFTLEDFQDVFAAMASSSVSTLLRGAVVVSTGLAADDHVPVDIRFTDMEGEMFTYAEVGDPATGSVAVTLTNATESKLRLVALPVWLRRGADMVEGRLAGIDLSQPLELAPSAAFSFTVQPVLPLPGEGPADAVFDTSSVSSLPDPEALLRLTLDRSVAQESERTISVMTAPDVLASAEAPENAIRLIVVEFRGNKRVTLDATTLQADVEVPVPLIDVLLRKDTEGLYKFRQTIIYKSGRQAVDPAWREGDLGVLFVPLA